MDLTTQIAKHFRAVHFGDNWTSVNLKDGLAGVSWQQATTQVYSLNTIAALVFHMNYYVEAISQVLRGKPLSSKDQFSFNHPPITSQSDWDRLVGKSFIDAENLATLVEQMPDSRLAENFYAEKYGSYYQACLCMCAIVTHSFANYTTYLCKCSINRYYFQDG